MEIFVDGASAGNPGPSGAGIVLKGENNVYKQLALPLGILTNHEAEFHAIKLGLEIALKEHPSVVRLYSDSKIAIRSIEKRYVKSPLFKPLLEEILTLIDGVPLFFIKWKNVSENKKADELAKQAIRQQK